MRKFALNGKSKLFLGVVVLLVLVLGLSYGTFLIGTDNYKVSELLIAELNYGIKIEADEGSTCSVDGTKVTTPVDTECFIIIQISSVNPIDSRYALAYKNLDGSATVQYTDKTQWKSEGVIDGYTEDTTYSRKVRVVIDNTGQIIDSIVDFKVFGGYKFNSKVSIDLNNGYQTIPGTYEESVNVGNKRLVDVIEKDTKCITSESRECLYGGGVITNYLQYPTSNNTNENLWRITGSYDLDGTIYAKVVYDNNYEANTSKDNIKDKLTNFYKTLNKPNEVIQDTNKFNCTKGGCAESAYSKIGLLSTYEYSEIGGYDSYLGISDNWFALDSETIKNITSSGIQEISGESGLRPTAYLKTDVSVTGKGTIDDPYKVSPKGDINLVAYTLEGKSTNDTFQDLLKNKTIKEIKCENGTKATWNYLNNSIQLTDVQVPDNCVIDFNNKALLIQQILKDNSTIRTREVGTFGTIFTGEAGLYKENGNFTEDINGDGIGEDVYYFAGNPNNNWVKFGKQGEADIWWRIIRTNEDGSVRLLYAGTSSDTKEGYITYPQQYNYTEDSTRFVGYMYGGSGSLESNRENTNNSSIKNNVDSWYETNLKKDYEKYLSRTAIYCNDRSTNRYKTSSIHYMYYGAAMRLAPTGTYFSGEFGGVSSAEEYHPTFKCGGDNEGGLWGYGGNIADKFTGVQTEINKVRIGNQQLKYPIALMTADEVVYAGGVYKEKNLNVYYYQNSNGESIIGNAGFWTMSPFDLYGDNAMTFTVQTHTSSEYQLSEAYLVNGYSVRPVVSIKKCALVKSGNGTVGNPYEVEVDDACALADN